MTRTRATLMTFLRNAFDFEHWLDARLPLTPVRELELESFWPLGIPNPEALAAPPQATFQRTRAANDNVELER